MTLGGQVLLVTFLLAIDSKNRATDSPPTPHPIIQKNRVRDAESV